METVMETTEAEIGWRKHEGEALRPPLHIVEQLRTALGAFYFEQITSAVVLPRLSPPKPTLAKVTVHPVGVPEVITGTELIK
jgi:hypothetical protein